MIRWFGELALYLALAAALIQSFFPLWGLRQRNPYLLSLARPSAIAQFCFIVFAYILLTLAFVNNDFSIAYVAANSHASLPLMYRLTAAWGAHEGSIFLWILMLSIWTFIISFQKKTAIALIIAILGLISSCFLIFLLFTSNPFAPTIGTPTGQDLNPLLQDPGFVIHPPMLYMGYVGFSVAFAITIAALIEGQLDRAWAKFTRQLATAAWCFLTLGITLGSWWAYRVLGWGGFWFWDPVENASLLPWLSGTALIHVLMLTEKRGLAKAWAALLAIITFALSLLGTFLVRSGVLVSAHTFANDPTRGVFLLLLLGLVLMSALLIYCIRLPRILTAQSAALPLPFFSKEMALLCNSAFLFLAMATILLGTLYPLIIDALQLGSLSVGAPYFNTVMFPLVLIVLCLMGFVPYYDWQLANSPSKPTFLWRSAIKTAGLSLLVAFSLLFYTVAHITLLALLSLSLGLWVILGLLPSLRQISPMALAHLGFAILIIGILLASLFNVERDVQIKPGEDVMVGPYRFSFASTKVADGPNYQGIEAIFNISHGQRYITSLYPQKRIYTVRDMVMTNVAINPGIFRDLYIALGQPLADDYWSVRIYYKPFIRWIWLGGLVMMIGGLLTFMPRHRLTKTTEYKYNY